MTTFVQWLRAQAKSDPEREQTFAELYAYGPYFVRSLGDGPPDPSVFKAHLVVEDVHQSEQDELLRQLIIADATWRTDSMDDMLPDGTDDERAAARTAKIIDADLATLPALRPAVCGFRDLDGTRCTSYAVEGAARCNDHGGGITDPQIRGSLMLLAYAQLVHGAAKAVSTLIDVMDTSSNDLARVNAAKEMLDRAGLTAEQHHTVTMSTEAVDTREAALERIRAHLDTTRERLMPAPPPDDDEIVDAELVDEVA